MMNRKQYLLLKLSEEAVEVAKVAQKAMQFGMDSFNPSDVKRETNVANLHSELNDLLGIVNMLNEEFGFEYVINEQALLAKRDKVNKYYAVSQRLGQIEKEPDNTVRIRVGNQVHLMPGLFAAPEIPKPVKNAMYVRRDGTKEGFVIVYCAGYERETMIVKCFTEKGWQLQDQHRWWDQVYYDFERVDNYPEWASIVESGR
ncbi:nucleoside triphosphate pyrophosphohydrolase [Yersinia phage fHe-Yen9-02]|nr:nucleoside triphosphate pyrophosphohydrolase [Yersinia phage fHe-Yen9-02]